MGTENGIANAGADTEDMRAAAAVAGEAAGNGGLAAEGVENIMGMTNAADG